MKLKKTKDGWQHLSLSRHEAYCLSCESETLKDMSRKDNDPKQISGVCFGGIDIRIVIED